MRASPGNAMSISRSVAPTSYARSGVGMGGTVQFMVTGTSGIDDAGFR